MYARQKSGRIETLSELHGEMGEGPMREEYMLAVRRESYELERELVDRRIDEAFDLVYQELDAAATFLRAVCDAEGHRALDQLERAYAKAVEYAARSGIGGTMSRRGAAQAPRQAIPNADASTPASAVPDVATGTDTLLGVRTSVTKPRTAERGNGKEQE